MPTKNLVDTMTALEVARRSSNPGAFTIIETMAMTNTMAPGAAGGYGE
jgi:hypothetical protein